MAMTFLFCSYFMTLVKVVKDVRKYEIKNITVPKAFSRVLSLYPNKPAILFEEQKWTFQDLENYSNKVANLLLKNGIKSGSSIALFMTNCPEYVGILLGASRIGVEVALINYNLRNKGLFHCINIADCCGIIYGKDLEDAIGDIIEQFDKQFQGSCFCAVGAPSASFSRSFDSEVEAASDDTVPLLPDLTVNRKLIHSSTDFICP